MIADAAPAQSLLALVISVAGGGTIVPLVYGVWRRRSPQAKVAAADKDRERIAKLSAEAVDAVGDVLGQLRAQRVEDKETIATLEGEKAQLENRVETLLAEHRRLTSGGGATTAEA